MKIAVVFHKMVYGGVERVGISYIKLLREKGHEIDVIILEKDMEAIVEEVKPYATVKVLNFPKYLCPEAYWIMAKKHSWGRFVFPITTVILAIAKPFLKAAYGITEQYDAAIAFSGYYNDLTFVADGYVRAKSRCAWIHGAQATFMTISPGYGNLYRKIKNLVCLSEDLDSACLTFNHTYGINKCKIYNPLFVNKDGADPDFIAQLKEQHGDFCLMVARFDQDKDQKTAILAMKYLRENFGLTKRLVLVGDGPLRAEVEEFVEQQQMRGQIYFAGTRSDVQNYYCAASVYVHSSPAEGLPTVLLEAMEFELPIAATNSMPGVGEILQGKCGLVTPVGDAQALAESIARLYQDAELRDRLVTAGKKRIRDFSPDTISDTVEKYLKSIGVQNDY